MSFCPNCRYEYESDVSVCPDCNVALVDALPKEPGVDDEPPDFEDWVPLARLTSTQYAQMLLEDLRDNDIPAVLQSGAGFFGITGQMGTSSFQPGGGAYTLMVPVEFVDDADARGAGVLGDDWERAKLYDID